MEQGTDRRMIALCGVQGCCPTAEFTTDGVVIRDDYDGQVRLSADEWAAFIARAKSGVLD